MDWFLLVYTTFLLRGHKITLYWTGSFWCTLPFTVANNMGKNIIFIFVGQFLRTTWRCFWPSHMCLYVIQFIFFFVLQANLDMKDKFQFLMCGTFGKSGWWHRWHFQYQILLLHIAFVTFEIFRFARNSYVIDLCWSGLVISLLYYVH